MAELLTAAAVLASRHFEQEPLSLFRRDVATEDGWRIEVEAAAAEVMRAERVAIAWAVRRIVRETYVDQNYVSGEAGS